jgi:hypoxanthine phosphoribosyltransferase
MTGAPVSPVLFDAAKLAAGCRRLASEIDHDYPDGVLLVAVLTGSLLFVADLMRALTVPSEVDFLGISAYRAGTGRVRLVKDLQTDIAGRHVLLVEAIVDTGLTCAYLTGELLRRGPATVEVCTLFDRRTRRIVPVTLRYVGFEAPDEMLVGYGLDVAGRYRNLTFVAAGDRDALATDPDAHVDWLYPR